MLAEPLEQFPEGDFAKTNRLKRQPQMFSYLDRVQDPLDELPYAKEVLQAAVLQEGLRRQLELLRGESAETSIRRGVLLMCAVVLSGAGEVGQQVTAVVREIITPDLSTHQCSGRDQQRVADAASPTPEAEPGGCWKLKRL